MNLKKITVVFFTFLTVNAFSQYDPNYNADDSDDLSELAFKDRLFTGGNFWAQFGNITNIDVSPLLGYRVTKDYSVGIGLKYNYYRVAQRNTGSFSTSIYGGSVFTRYVLLDKFVLHGEFELLNVELFNTRNAGERAWIPLGLVGGGYVSNGFQMMLLYDLIGDQNNPYIGMFGADSRIYLRVGFLFNL
ncbi:MAG: hypothetical protein ABF242_04980 [Flavobacteriales bacterium]